MTTNKNIKINDSNETRIALLEQSIGHIDQTLMRIESRLDNLDKSLNEKMNRIENRMDKLDNRLWQILFIILSSNITIVIGKIYHWF